ncbi:MAG: extracellular solute-binding protein [Clostridia bacterium]|nr:extracellular solute-binding protein [Clostridia bacterium]
MKKFSRVLALLFAVAIFATACTSEKKAVSDVADLSSYPIKTEATLSYYMPLRSALAGQIDNYAETPFAKEAEKRTGVKVDYVHPAIGQESQMLSLLIASGELPDIMWGNWYDFADGIDSAINDGIIISLNDYKEYAPAYFGKLSEVKDWDVASKTDELNYYGFLALSRPPLQMTTGLALRSDWLKELSLDVPETVDEWETVLTAFKEKKGATAPFSAKGLSYNLFSMFGCHFGLYIQDGEFRYDYIEPQRKEALAKLNDWFNKGLLDKNIVSADAKMIDTQLLTGETGASIITGGDIGRLTKASTTEGFSLCAAKYPTKERGEFNETVPVSYPASPYQAATISGQCKYPELAVKYMDYFYTEEGGLFSSFGVEGETYTMVDGEPVFTDLIMKNPDGLSVQETLGLYVKSGAKGAFESDNRYTLQYYELPEQKDALVQWSKDYEASRPHREVCVSFTPEESEEVAAIKAELDSYSGSMFAKFVTGQESLDKFDKYVDTMNKYGVDRMLEIYNTAYARYLKR